MRALVLAVLLPSILLATHGAEFGRWNWPPSLEKLWAPIVARGLSVPAESDYSFATATTHAQHYRYFAQHTRPEAVIPDMITDLRAHPSGWHFEVYAQVMREWPRERVLATLRPFEYSLDSPLLRQLIPFRSTLDDSAVADIAHRFASVVRADE